MSLAGPRSSSASSKPLKKSKKGPLSTPLDEDVVETSSSSAKRSTAEKRKGKGKEKEKEVEIVANDSEEVLPSSKPEGKAVAPKKGILKNGKQQAPSKTSLKKSHSKKDSDDEGADAEVTEEQEILLHGFSSESDSSDEEDDEGMDDAPLDVGKLPTIAKDDASVKRRLEKAKKQAVRYHFQSTVSLFDFKHRVAIEE